MGVYARVCVFIPNHSKLPILCPPVWQVTFRAVQGTFMPFVSLAGSDYVTWPAGHRAREKILISCRDQYRTELLIIDHWQPISAVRAALSLCQNTRHKIDLINLLSIICHTPSKTTAMKAQFTVHKSGHLWTVSIKKTKQKNSSQAAGIVSWCLRLYSAVQAGH